jgi:hypothetical protein
MRYFYKGVRERGAGNNIRNKRHDVTGSWTKLHNEQLHNLYPSTNTIRMIMPRGLLVFWLYIDVWRDVMPQSSGFNKIGYTEQQSKRSIETRKPRILLIKKHVKDEAFSKQVTPEMDTIFV